MTAVSPPSGLTALHVAVNTGCQETVRLLLERGADIDAVVSREGAWSGARGRGDVAQEAELAKGASAARVQVSKKLEAG